MKHTPSHCRINGASYVQRMVRMYGTTPDPYLGGFLLPDGRFLDFSEGSGSRSQDHRNITWVSIRPEYDRESRTDVMDRICKRAGMYRWMPESWMIEAWSAPTPDQMWVLRELFRHKAPILELHRGRTRFYREYEPYERGQAFSDLLTFYRVG